MAMMFAQQAGRRLALLHPSVQAISARALPWTHQRAATVFLKGNRYNPRGDDGELPKKSSQRNYARASSSLTSSNQGGVLTTLEYQEPPGKAVPQVDISLTPR